MMKTKKTALKPFALATSAVIWCALNVHAQSGPTITNQPASQTVLPGANVNFSVTASGVGPLSYQWQFNGTNLPNDIITTVAGNGKATYAGDGGPATNASLYYPGGGGFSVAGDLYISDFGNDRVRKIGTNGIITTVAGNGTEGYAGDGGWATNASLHHPHTVAFDAAGNLYIPDMDNDRIRKVDTLGRISTVAGTGTPAYAGDGGAATNASLSAPGCVAFDPSGNWYIADAGNSRIRRVDTNGIITTVAGNGGIYYSGDGGAATNAGLGEPLSVALDAAGALYIADPFNFRIRKVDTNGIVTTVAGKTFSLPTGVALDAAGAVYIGEQNANRIRKVDTSGIISTIAGNGNPGYSGDGGAATNASLNNPSGMAFDAVGNLYIADLGNNCIREVHFAGFPTFALTNVSVTNAGSYMVVVTSPYGSVTSAVATLTVQAPPAITSQPASQAVVAGSSPVFSVAVVGSGPFGYWWYFASTNLVQSGTNSALTLPAVFTNSAGNYTVVVTNAYGSVTSAVAVLTVTIPRTPPQIIASDASFGFRTNHFGFNLSGAFGQTIVVDGSTDLVGWTPIFTNTVVGSPFYFYDPASTNYPWRFYRARLP